MKPVTRAGTRMVTSKKALLAARLVDFYAYLAFLLIIIVFYILFSMGKGSMSVVIGGDVAETSATTELLAVMRTPVLVDGSYITMAELVALAEKSPKYEAVLEKEAKELARLFGGDNRGLLVKFSTSEKLYPPSGHLSNIEQISSILVPISGGGNVEVGIYRHQSTGAMAMS